MKQEKLRLLFVCLGNICRSPSAEGVMKKLVKESGLEHKIEIDSAGILSIHQGELPDPRMRKHASDRGYLLDSRSRPVKIADFYNFDLIIGMDDQNIQDLKKLAPDLESSSKIHRMSEYLSTHVYDHIPDPYYGGAEGFELVLDLLEDACSGLLEVISSDRDS
jgi:protein-tyrosine phosphatase